MSLDEALKRAQRAASRAEEALKHAADPALRVRSIFEAGGAPREANPTRPEPKTEDQKLMEHYEPHVLADDEVIEVGDSVLNRAGPWQEAGDLIGFTPRKVRKMLDTDRFEAYRGRHPSMGLKSVPKGASDGELYWAAGGGALLAGVVHIIGHLL